MKKIFILIFSPLIFSSLLFALTASSTDAGSIIVPDSFDPIEFKIQEMSAKEKEEEKLLLEKENNAENKNEEVAQGQIYPEAKKTNLNIPGLDHELTKKYIELYQSKTNSAWIAQSLVNSAPYRPYIRQKLKEKNMPSYLQYLPIIESNYKVTAVSKSGAKGIWQFMENSMAPMLKKTSWYDERYDPWKETDAALVKLMDNYKMFGDWNIAIAAYNCGGGAMRRLLKAHPKADFWYLAENNLLRTETKLYVPKLLAVAELIENAEYYGLLNIGVADKMIEFEEVTEFDYVEVNGIISTEELSKVIGIEKDEIEFLNPSLLKKMTPPEKFSLRLAKGSGPKAQEALSKIDLPKDFITYTVQKGDNLSAIARTYGVSVDAICKASGISKDSILSIGQKLSVPIYEK